MGGAGVEGEASESVVGVVAGLVRDIATAQGVGAAAGGALSGGVVAVADVFEYLVAAVAIDESGQATGGVVGVGDGDAVGECFSGQAAVGVPGVSGRVIPPFLIGVKSRS